MPVAGRAFDSYVVSPRMSKEPMLFPITMPNSIRVRENCHDKLRLAEEAPRNGQPAASQNDVAAYRNASSTGSHESTRSNMDSLGFGRRRTVSAKASTQSSWMPSGAA